MTFQERNSLALSDFLKYLSSRNQYDMGRLPSLTEISQELEISVASLREQLEVARVLGLVEVKPKTGIRRLSYSFKPAVYTSVGFAVACHPDKFQSFADLRNQLEAAYYHQAVDQLTSEDRLKLRTLVDRALRKLEAVPIQIPHYEHRELHLTMYSRLNNPFVTGILEAFWELYEVSGLDLYTELDYLQRVWQYHKKIVDNIIAGDLSSGFQALIEHQDLLFKRPAPVTNQRFE